MQGVILAAGRGSRLRHLTRHRSKAMLPVVDRPIVAWVAKRLIAAGAENVILVISPGDREIVRYFDAAPEWAGRVRFAVQSERLGMAHALGCAAPYIDGDFVLSACDNLVPPDDVTRVLREWRASPRADAVLTLMPVEPGRLGSVGIVEMDGARVTRIVEKPAPEEAPSNISSLPLYCFSECILDLLPDVPLSPRGEHELQDAIQMLIERGGLVRGVLIDRRMTLTDSDDLLAINRRFLLRMGGLIGAGLGSVRDQARLVPPVYVGDGVTVGEGCVLGPGVVIEGQSVIGAGAVVRDAVVLRGGVVEERASVMGRVLG
jgi:dTDP-glucose pyrophosphorylase